MARFLKDRTKAKGEAPGSLILIGNQKMETPVIQIMQFDAQSLFEKELPTVNEAFAEMKSNGVNWINIYGIHDLEMIKDIGQKFNLPSLLLEDILNTDHRPKYENGEDYDAFILKMLRHEKSTNKIHAEQISIILGENYLLTLQERKGDVFAPVRDRIRKNRGRVRSSNNDYLAYALMDTIADNYMNLVENLGEKVEDIEDRIFLKQDKKIVEQIHQFKTELNFLRKAVRPVKEFVSVLLKTESSCFQDDIKMYLRDLNDVVMQSAEAIELYNNLASDQLNSYNSNVSNSMNEVMKVLTIFAAIFIPLTFMAGIYGMNFEYLPELKYKYAYAIFWGITLLVGTGLVIYFKRKKWL